MSIRTVSFTTEPVHPTPWAHDYQCQKALRSTSLRTEREAVVDQHIYFKHPTRWLCVQSQVWYILTPVVTLHSLDNPLSTCTGGPKTPHMCQTWRTLAVKSFSVWPLRSLNMQRLYWTSMTTQQDALGCSQDTAGSLIYPRTTPPPPMILPAAESQISYL